MWPEQLDYAADRAKWGRIVVMTDQQPAEVGSLFARVPYDYGAVAPAGALLFTAGACPLDADGNVVGVGDPVTQARVSLDNLTIALHRYGARLEDLVKTSVYVVGDRHDLAPCGKSSPMVWRPSVHRARCWVFPPWVTPVSWWRSKE